MNKQAFNARARVGRHIASMAKQAFDAWSYDQAKEYARSGHIGPDFRGWLDWYWREDSRPRTAALGSLREASRRGWGR